MPALGTEGPRTSRAVSSPTPRGLEWAAGFIEGEGSFSRTGGAEQVSVQHVDWGPVVRLLNLFGGGVYAKHPGNDTQRASLQWHVNGSRARGVMMTLYGLLSDKRREQIRKAMR